MARRQYFMLVLALLLIIYTEYAKAWTGNYCSTTERRKTFTTVHSGLWGWGRSTVARYYTVTNFRCCDGWEDEYHDGNCNTPICTTPCYNGGTCIAPNKCECPPSHRDGAYCATLLCSHKSPCYPGACSYPHSCTCTKGFSGSSCLNFDSNNNPPKLTSCDLTLARIRRTDGKQLFYFNIPCTDGPSTDVIWCNQALFNYVKFTMASYYEQIPNLPPKPKYVTSSGFGIVYSGMHVTHTKVHREGVSGEFVALNKEYRCMNGENDTTPVTSALNCTTTEPNYKINIEHADRFTVEYTTRSGGFQKLYDIDNRRPYQTDTYSGQSTKNKIEFKFDFIAPTHCSETNTRCSHGDAPIHIDKDITRQPIIPRWSGWSDELSGLSYYYMEIFKLEPDIHGDLTETNPLKPIHTYRTNKTTMPSFQTYTPDGPGMYSILLQASDKANNSKIARKLFLYDNTSSITLTKPGFVTDYADKANMKLGDGGMHVISAIPETGYMWQTSDVASKKVRVVVNWQNHFANKVHDHGKFLNKVLPYPTQFQDLEDDGILRSKKYVALDDNDGNRTKTAIPNKHGIVKFELHKVYSADTQVPKNWTAISLTEQWENIEYIDEGKHLRIWIKATDIVNNVRTDFTEVHIDNSSPVLKLPSQPLVLNIKNGTFLHTSRVSFTASDGESGVHKIEYSLFIENSTDVKKVGHVLGNRNNESNACKTDPNCRCVLGECFLAPQTVDIDNCWFIVPKEDLNKSATVTITVYNQALLSEEFTVNISMLRHLKGLEEYSGPTNIRVEKKLSNGVRLAWDLPKKASCYGRVDIDIIIYTSNGPILHRVYNEETSYDLIGLSPDSDYSVGLSLEYDGTALGVLPYSFKTAPKDNFLAGGTIAAIVVSIVVVFGVMVVVFVVLLRRGHMQPVRRGLHAMSVKYRKSTAEGSKQRRSYTNNAYSAKTERESLYMYGEMDFNECKQWHMSRSAVVFESLLKTGNFASIFKARLESSGNSRYTSVVAKTLKDGINEADEFLMRAKINFTALVVGDHDNILKFVGAVVDNSDIGPFIVYEYCENGTMKEYLDASKNNITLELQENLFRFGLGVARGMEYLAEKKIVHRRLAARNILLGERLEVKISGFGPQPDETKNEGDNKPEKRERIPIKWTAPECFKSTVDASEKSDMWSYGVVLWEIFALGATPYANIKGRDLPGRVKSGERLSKPEQSDDKWFGVMQRAWNISPKKRPTFQQVRNELDEMFVSAPTDDYYYYRR